MDKKDLYKEAIYKEAGIGGMIAGGLGKMLGAGTEKGLGKFIASNAAKRVATGAAVGTGVGALTYKPHYDAAGNDVNGGRLSHAINGGIVGGMAGSALGKLNPTKAIAPAAIESKLMLGAGSATGPRAKLMNEGQTSHYSLNNGIMSFGGEDIDQLFAEKLAHDLIEKMREEKREETTEMIEVNSSEIIDALYEKKASAIPAEITEIINKATGGSKGLMKKIDPLNKGAVKSQVAKNVGGGAALGGVTGAAVSSDDHKSRGALLGAMAGAGGGAMAAKGTVDIAKSSYKKGLVGGIVAGTGTAAALKGAAKGVAGAGKAIDQMSGAATGVGKVVGDAKGLAGKATDAVKDVAGKVSDKAKSVDTKPVKDFANSAIDAGKAKANEIKNTLKEKLTKSSEELADEILKSAGFELPEANTIAAKGEKEDEKMREENGVGKKMTVKLKECKTAEEKADEILKGIIDKE